VNIVIGTVILWAAAVWLWTRLPNPAWRNAAIGNTWSTLKFTMPRVVVALLGAGLFAELLPEDQMRGLFGDGAGLIGLLLAIALGPITLGGAFVSFAIGAAALKSGAAPLAVLGYVTSWSLFSVTKILAYEAPILGTPTLWKRLAVSIPVPLIVVLIAHPFLR